jgi:hypothetical protein
MKTAKEQSRGVSCDMSPDAVASRLEIVDELRELAWELQNAKRLGPIEKPILQTRETLRNEIAKGFENLDAGKGVPCEQVYSRAEKRTAEIERSE